MNYDAYIITLDNEDALKSYDRLTNSIARYKCELNPIKFDAVTPETMGRYFNYTQKWTWPLHQKDNGVDPSTFIYRKYYPAKNPLKVIACAVSHLRLWEMCANSDQPMVILEQDSLFINQLKTQPFEEKQKWGAVGINDPRGTTRKALKFYKMVMYNADRKSFHQVPDIDEVGNLNLPMGLAGGSAYIIRPWAAKEVINMTKKIGLWPNDAILCKQLFPWLRVYTPFLTKVQGTVSTTTR